MGTQSPAVRFLLSRLPCLRARPNASTSACDPLQGLSSGAPLRPPFFCAPHSAAGVSSSASRELGGHVPAQPREVEPASREYDAEERAVAVRALLERYRTKYFADGRPEVSDDVYDSLQRELGRLESQLRGTAAGGEARPVGAPPLERLDKAQHRVPMLSLAAVGSLEELQAWRQRLDNYVASSAFQQSQGGESLSPEALAACRWVVEPKVDGLAVRLTYLGGQLAQAATRGDGAVGEDVTHNAVHIQGIPLSVPEAAGDFEVRGEVFIAKDDYRLVNEAQEAEGEEPFASARNAAAGSLRLLDPESSRGRRLSFVAYQLLVFGDHREQLRSHWEALEWLKGAGFPVSPDNVLAATFEEAAAAAQQWMGGRESLAYEVDGAVLKVDSSAARKALGSVGADPRWAVAWKFPAAQATTRLLGIEMSLGRTGQLTPVAILEPVAIGGVSVARASLHNVGLVAKLGLMIGDTVVVERAGDVIPQVAAAIPELRAGSEEPWEMPQLCPACGSAVAVVRESDADIARCLNSSCPGQAERLLQHFVGTCIKGVGDAAVSQLVDEGLVATAADLYDLDAEALERLEGFRALKARNHVEAIQRTRPMPVATLLVGLGIPLVGRKAAGVLAAKFGTLERLIAASEEDLTDIPGFGPKMAASVRQWCEREPNQRLVESLQRRGVVAEPEIQPPTCNNPKTGAPTASKLPPFAGMAVVVTGAFQKESKDTGKRISRTEAGSLIEAGGGRLVSSVSAKTDLMVAASKPGKSKMDAASKLGVRVVDEAAFWRLVQGDEAGDNP